jgi:hypothetical protein
LKLRYGRLDPHALEVTVEGCHTPEYIARHARHIAEHGVKNPVLVAAREGRLTVSSGNTRVLACRELGVEVPALVADHDARFPHFKEIKGERQVRALFPSGLRYLGLTRDHVTLAPFKIPLEDK